MNGKLVYGSFNGASPVLIVGVDSNSSNLDGTVFTAMQQYHPSLTRNARLDKDDQNDRVIYKYTQTGGTKA